MRLVYNKYKGDKTVYYLQQYMSLDIETSWNHDPDNPICWVTSIQTLFDGDLRIFRLPSEWLQYMQELYEYYELDYFHRLMIIVHNLSFDISYLLPFLQCEFPYGIDEYSFINKEHKITCYRQGGLEFRDTYALTNKSLAVWGKDMNVEHKKQEGLYDYEKIIYQDDILTEEEELYDSYDVLCLHEAFKEQLNLEGDTVASIPFTSTGYIRRSARRECSKNKAYMQTFKASRLEEDSFHTCLWSFAGGYTHNNRHLKSRIIYGLIGHGDFRSHYPTQLRVNPVPVGVPQVIYDPRNRSRDRLNKWTVQNILDLWPKYSTITKLYIKKAQLKDKNISMPFMQFSKMKGHVEGKQYVLDNGRVIHYEGGCTMYVDNLLLKILYEQYNIKGYILEITAFKNAYIPECLAKVIDTYFKAKTDEKIKLKHIVEEHGEFSNEAFAQRAVLQHKKAGLNGIYGMMCQNPVIPVYDINYNDEDRDLSKIYLPLLNQKPDQEALDEYYNSRNSFLIYQIGCFTTAYARYELYEYIKAIGYENALYCDTDSIFYLKSPEVEERIDKLNAIKRRDAEALEAYITDSNGKKVYYDVFEREDDGKAFKGLHSKCYGIITEEHGHDILIATIAGIPARTLIGIKEGEKIYLTREEELSGITAEMKLQDPTIQVDPYKALENLHDNFTFYTNTGTCSKYINQRPHVEVVDGHLVETGGGCIIRKLEEKKITDWEYGSYDFEDFESEVESL